MRNEIPVKDKIVCDTHVPCENHLREKNLSRMDSNMLNNAIADSDSLENYIVCDKCSELIEEHHFTTHNLNHNRHGRLT